jgi:hypothetical protein
VQLDAKLRDFTRNHRALPGIDDPAARTAFLEQVIESLRRIEFARFLVDEDFDERRTDPSEEIFDPLRAAVFWARRGDMDEACWLVFLFVHFGRHPKDRWRLVRDIYGALGGDPWTWKRVSEDPRAFRDWLAANERRLQEDGVSRRFGNHRKYETLRADSQTGTAAVVESYVAWVGPSRSHKALVQNAHKKVGQNPRVTFEYLYQSMSSVARFGRLAKFDYLTMLEKLGLAPLVPPRAYLDEATGPRLGARLLFADDAHAKLPAKELDGFLVELDASLGVGMQVLEDALCNWQKTRRYSNRSGVKYRAFPICNVSSASSAGYAAPAPCVVAGRAQFRAKHQPVSKT